MSEQYSVGFIGIGLMGQPLTLRLLNAGFTVRVWNRTAEKMQPVIKAGAIACAEISELVKASDVVILCLADTQTVETVVMNDIMACGSDDKLLIDLSTIHPEITRRLAAALEKQCGMRWVDAPVSGGTAGAEQGTLAIMAGGAEEDIAVARQVLKPLYAQLTRMGEVGSGQVTKICNQMLVSCQVMVIAEMMALAKSEGVDVAQIPAALTGGFADSKPLQITGMDIALERFEPVKWKVRTLLKDLSIAVDLASTMKNAIPMSGLAMQLMQLHGNKGFLDHDPATLIELFKKAS